MATQFVNNDKGEIVSVIIPIEEYEDLLHHHHHADLELTDEYKQMIDQMLEEEANGNLKYVSSEHIENKFKR